MAEGFKRVLIGEIASLSLLRIAVDPAGRYPMAGVLNAGRGMFDRGVLKGSQTSYASLHQLASGQLVMRKLTAWEGPITVVPEEFAGFHVSTEFPTFAMDRTAVLPGYMRCICQQPSFWEEMRLRSTGSVQRRKRLSAAALMTIGVALPPIEEQRRIVDLLSALEGYRQLLGTISDESHQLGESLREDAFGQSQGPTTPLGDLCEADGIQLGPFGSQLHAGDYVQDGIPCVMPKDMVDGAVRSTSVARVSRADWQRLKRHRLKIGDILLPRRGDLSKRALITATEEGWLCGTGCARVRISKVDPQLVFEALSTNATNQWLSDHAVGATMPNLNTAIIRAIPVQIPSDGAAKAMAAIGAASDLQQEAGSRAKEWAETAPRMSNDLLTGLRRLPASYDGLLDETA